MNPINIKVNKCFQYTITVESHYSEENTSNFSLSLNKKVGGNESHEKLQKQSYAEILQNRCS